MSFLNTNKLKVEQKQNFFSNQLKFEEKLRESNSEKEKKDAIFNYLKEVSSNSEIVYEDFPKDLNVLNSDKTDISLKQYENHILVLDFFTYCCINCLHILPTLKKVESYYEHIDNFEVIGVHSAKFENEKVLENVQDAVKRHNITHKVICDPQGTIWNQMSINFWPTVLILGPKNSLLFLLIGENKIIEWLHLFCESALQYFYPNLKIDNSNYIPKSEIKHPLTLNYPSKVSLSPDYSKIAISDTGHNRIVVVDIHKDLATSIGGLNSGNVDGCFQSALFTNPQGLCWVNNDRLIVADTGNNCLKFCNFDDDTVSIIQETKNVIKFVSPWDLCLNNNIIFIACAGSHLIFGLPLEDNVKILNKVYNKFDLFKLAGTGLEENRNNLYLNKASFSQPSGIVYSKKNDCLFIADSESSSIRIIDLASSQVRNLVGGSINPNDLFCFGDKDDQGMAARLQHPLGVTIDDKMNSIYVADTFNHKIKVVDYESQRCLTIAGIGQSGNKYDCSFLNSLFSEPNDVTYSKTDNLLYVADTNNHQIKILNLSTKQVFLLQINFIKRITTENNNKVVKELPLLKVSKRNSLTFKSDFKFSKDFLPSKNAPHFFKMSSLADKSSWFEISQYEVSIVDFDNQPEIQIKFTERAPHFTRFNLEGIIYVYYCSTLEDFCSFKEVTFKIPVVIDPHDVRTDNFNVYLTFELKI